MVVMVCWSYLCEGRAVGVMVVMVSFSYLCEGQIGGCSGCDGLLELTV